MKNITIEKICKIKNSKLENIIDTWDEYDTDTIFLTYFELKRRNLLDQNFRMKLSAIFFNFKEIDKTISTLVDKNGVFSYDNLLLTTNYLSNMKVSYN